MLDATFFDFCLLLRGGGEKRYVRAIRQKKLEMISCVGWILAVSLRANSDHAKLQSIVNASFTQLPTNWNAFRQPRQSRNWMNR